MSNLSIRKALSFPDHPWLTFSIFLTANTFLSYYNLPPKEILMIGLLGLILPSVVALVARRSTASHQPLYRREFLPPIPLWVYGGLAVLAVFVRFYRLTDLFAWPNGDEGIYAYFSLAILRKGVERLLYTSAQVPFLYPSWLALQFKLWGPSLGNLWFWPAFFSVLTIPLCYLAARHFFSKSFSFLCALVTAFCFWVWYMARFSECTALIPLAEVLVFLGMGKLFGEFLEKKRRLFSFVLGLELGLVLYAIYLQWLAVIVVVAATVLIQTRKSPVLTGLFAAGFALAALPFAVLALGPGLPGYVGYLGRPVFNHGGLFCSYFYLQSLFWGLPVEFYTYQPSWGGFFNPLLGSLCFLGILEALKNFSNTLYRWLLASFFILLLPGVLSKDMEAYRILPILVAVIPLIALGTARLLEGGTPKRALLVLAFLFLPSTGLDFYHLAGPCHRLWDSPDYWVKSVKAISSYRAFPILEEKSRAEGPGLVFQDFNPINSDQTLSLADYSFDVVANREKSFEEARWAALLVNVHYRPFLDRRMGAGRAIFLSKGFRSPDGGRMLWVIPVTDLNRTVLKRWYEADLALDGFRDASLENIGYFWGRPSVEPFQKLEQAYPAFQGDPFLRSCFWEKMADCDFKARRIPEAIGCLQKAVRQGCPATHLYYRLGALYMIQGNRAAARSCWQKAARTPMDLTESRLLLDQFFPATTSIRQKP
jgi:tetratricopeptide (TPR) repeat protein